MRESVRHLSKGVAIYGAGDAAVQVVNVLLLAVYVKGDYLSRSDYGALALVLAVEMMAKIVTRWGLDGAFMRFYHERPSGGPLETLTSTIVWFTLAADAIVFGALLLASGWIGARVFTESEHVLAFRLMLANTFLLCLTYIPYHLMRLRNEAVTYSAVSFVRAAGTTVARVVFVISMGWGLAGWFAADLLMTLLLLPALWRWMGPLVRARFSTEDLRIVLLFGLPRLPHGLAQQGLEAGNKWLLNRFIPLPQLGVYQMGFTFGTAIRFFTSAFETAWAPFYYATSRQPGAPETFAKLSTYAVAVLTLLVALTVVAARDVILVALEPEYLDAARVIPIVATAMALQGIYLLTSIGLNLTSQTRYYPVATFAALGVGLAGGALLMPRMGITGAAIAFLASALTQTATAFYFARRAYPIPYEVGRLARVLGAGVAASMAGLWLIPDMGPVAGVILRPLAALAVFAGLLGTGGFLRRSERAFAAEALNALRRRRAPAER